jgi:hypothetical protein
MITIAGSVERSFIFPAPLGEAFEFYADLNRTLSFLTHISLVEQRSEQRFRMLYHTVELGLYRVYLYCDIQSTLVRTDWALHIQPDMQPLPVRQEFGLNHLTAQGYYSSESMFYPSGDQTRIEYFLKLNAKMPVPFGARVIPESVLNSIAHNITQWRIHEIVEGFIHHSIQTYQGS